MGGRGKVEERERARLLRGAGWRLADIAREVGASKGSVSVWVRDVPFDRPPPSRAAPRRRGPNALERRKRAEMEELLVEGRARVGTLSERDLLIAGAALYAGEGAKRDRQVRFANTDPRMVRLFCLWLRTFFDIDESRLRVAIYLHDGLDLDAATASGQRSPTFLQHSSASRTGWWLIDPSVARSTRSAASTSFTRAPARTGP